jgi:hypothetical protein
MYCPQCGQQQVSDVVRFCSRCGFLLEGVTAVVASGGTIPARYIHPRNQQLSARSKGVRQGAMLMLSTLLIVPLISIISVFFLGNPEVIIPITAILCFGGGLLRILYAVLMEDNVPQMDASQMIGGYSPPVSPQVNQSARNAALPPASANSASNWIPRTHTAETYRPPSITENTTRLLDKEDPKTR